LRKNLPSVNNLVKLYNGIVVAEVVTQKEWIVTLTSLLSHGILEIPAIILATSLGWQSE